MVEDFGIDGICCSLVGVGGTLYGSGPRLDPNETISIYLPFLVVKSASAASDTVSGQKPW